MLKGTVKTAFQLAAPQKRAIEDRFFEILGDAVSLEEQLDPSLIAGILVEIDGRVYDGSLKSRLNQVEKVLQGEDKEA